MGRLIPAGTGLAYHKLRRKRLAEVSGPAQSEPDLASKAMEDAEQVFE